ncbi:hypothetical protein [Paraburkholderia sp. DHOC27]|uniref:hypothetical protein n=1 Tax=Paraburkholderia sp. DHOC27 TaxID=2303330 RepID=UPI000E3B7649|nr:hypothetical protein [Paraburkholderia sp. DHOC27]RFU44520.1 hypothetical protein D0B32_28385 [Paraburkholderia sp. DHOC27]
MTTKGKTFLDQLLEPSDESRAALRTQVKLARQRMRNRADRLLVRSTSIAEAIKVDEGAFNNFMQGRQRLPESAHQKLAHYLVDKKLVTAWDDGQEEARNPGALFYALAHFLDVSGQTLDNLSKEAPGLYTMWRSSTHLPGKYVKGMLRIEHDEVSKVISTREVQRYSGGDGTVAISETFEGNMIKKARHYIMFSRQTQRSGPPRITVLDNVLFEDGKIVVMQGMTAGFYGENALFCAPIYLERVTVDEDELKNGLYIDSDIPESVKLKLEVRVSHGIVWF